MGKKDETVQNIFFPSSVRLCRMMWNFRAENFTASILSSLFNQCVADYSGYNSLSIINFIVAASCCCFVSFLTERLLYTYESKDAAREMYAEKAIWK